MWISHRYMYVQWGVFVKPEMMKMIKVVMLTITMKVLVCQSSLTLCNPLDCSPPGSSVHGILQTRILEWVTISFSRGSSWPRDWTRVSCVAGRYYTVWDTREAWQSPEPLSIIDLILCWALFCILYLLHDLHFINKETEADVGWVTSPGWHLLGG